VNGGGDASCSAALTSGGGDPAATAGNPDGTCTHLALPAEAQAVDTRDPTTVVGNGTAASCTFAALASAVEGGGTITFNCGEAPVTIPVTSPLLPPTSNAYANESPIQIVIDGGNKVTLDGGKSNRVFFWNHDGSWLNNQDTLTLQHLRIIHGKASPTEAIPACPAAGDISNTACSQGYNDGEGGALYMRDGALRVIDCIFEDNEAAPLGPDTGGGALYITATAEPVYIVQSSFLGNKASNAGAVGMLWAGGFVFNSLFDGNSAVGSGANNNDPSQCTCINNGQNEVGSGGNGGALYKDGGDGFDVTVCGTQLRNNSANEFGAAAFFTADGSDAKLVIVDSLMKNNASPISYWNWCVGVSTDTASSSPQPVSSSFCDTSGDCDSTCSG